MKNYRTILLSGFVLFIGAAGLAVAQGQSTPPAGAQTPATTQAAPVDDAAEAGAPQTREERRAARRDRSVDAESFGNRRLERMRDADADADGELSRTEIEDLVLRQMVERRANRMERRMDVDGDGTVTLAEVENQQAKRFAYLDRNEDGELDRREMRRARSDKDGGERHGRHHHRMHDRGNDFRN